MNRVNKFKTVLWIIFGIGLASLITRFLFGLGSVANMSDAVPWGLWKGFNVFPGIALSAGGFVVTAVIYIMGGERFHRYAKVAVLLAFLGYISAATALVTELGIPWMVWHPIIYWQPHSALFEVSWCVMIYLTILFLEFLPVPLEETSRFAKIRRLLIKYKMILVFLGIMISTLHQSSLGTMWLLAPYRIPALWFTSLVPVLFFISAVAVGPMMLILAVLTISHLYKKTIEYDILNKLAIPSIVVAIIYGFVRLIDIGIDGKFSNIFDGSWRSIMFIVEMALIFVVPTFLLGFRKLRQRTSCLWFGALSMVIGVLLNRANMAFIVHYNVEPFYFPTLFEIFISLAIYTGAILAFFFVIERFKIWENKWDDPGEEPQALPEFSGNSRVCLGTPHISARTIFSFIFIFSLSFGFAMLPMDRIQNEGVYPIKTEKARGGDTLFVDGNHDLHGVLFNHEFHIQKNGDKQSCVLCHHSNIPLDKESSCTVCHSKMYQASDAFRHEWHSDPEGANIACGECHLIAETKSAASAKECTDCHKRLSPLQAGIQIEKYTAPSYADAMHGTCISCHQQKMKILTDRPELTLCTTCHQETIPEYMQSDYQKKFKKHYFNQVVIPNKKLIKTEKMTND
jgi:Ni/Fe-hydrogenase subunit HybB-like protein